MGSSFLGLKPKLSRVLLAAGLIAVFVYNHFVYDLQPGVAQAQETLNELQKQVLDTLFEMTKLLLCVRPFSARRVSAWPAGKVTRCW